MRKLMWFAIGFGGACAACAYAISGCILLFLAAGFLAAAVGAALLSRRIRQSRVAAMVCLGCTVGLCWFWLFDIAYLHSAGQLEGQTAAVTAEATDYSYETAYGTAVDAAIYYEGKPYRVRMYLNEETAVSPGDEISGTFRFRVTTGGEQEATYHPGKGIFLLAYPAGETQIAAAEQVPWRYFASCLRQRVLMILDQTFPGDTAAFARALLLGDTTKLDYATDTALKLSGIRHIVAVSGLHVAILFSLVYQAAGKHRVLTALFGIPVLILFAAVAGFTPSITRACIMQVLAMLALLCKREYDPPTAVSFAALAMLLGNPLVITSISFQLSIGCIAGIFLFSGKIRSWILDEKRLGPAKGKTIRARLVRWFAGGVSMTLGALVLTTPLTAYYFGAVSLIGVVTNLLTLWVVTVIFCGTMTVCLAGAIWISAGKAIAWVISWPIRYVLAVAKGLASFPLAAVYTRSDYIVAWLVFCYILLAVFLMSKRKHPAVLGCCAALGLCLALLASWAEPLMDNFRMTVLDVGQGQCILLQSQGRTYMVDCGGDNDETTADIAAETLLSQGINHLDGLILTHYDRDHAGGAEYLLSRVPADALFLPDIEDDEGLGSEIIASAPEAVCLVQENLVLAYGTTQIILFPAESGDSDNESGLCILFQAENCDILITGDRSTAGEYQLLKQMDIPQLEALIVGHHGSKYSTSLDLLEKTQPRVAIISVGADNPYGHPAQEVLDRLAAYGCLVLRTDIDGTILFRG